MARRRGKGETRTALLEAAREEIIRGGGDFEIGEVARQAGVSIGLPYHHFGSKAGMLTAVVEDFYDRLDAAIDVEFAAELPWAERERRRTELFVNQLLSDPLSRYAMAELAAVPEVAATAARRLNDVIDEGARNIAQGQRQGEVRRDMDAGTLSAALHGAIRQVVLREMSRADAVDRARLQAAIWSLVAAWLLTGGDRET